MRLCVDNTMFELASLVLFIYCHYFTYINIIYNYTVNLIENKDFSWVVQACVVAKF